MLLSQRGLITAVRFFASAPKRVKDKLQSALNVAARLTLITATQK